MWDTLTNGVHAVHSTQVPGTWEFFAVTRMYKQTPVVKFMTSFSVHSLVLMS